MRKKRGIILCQSKGGDGKTFIAYAVAQMMLEKWGLENCLFLDADNDSRSFSKHTALKVKAINLKNNSTDQLERFLFNDLFEGILEEKQPYFLIDLGADSSEQFKNYIHENGSEMLNQLFHLDIISPVSGGINAIDSVKFTTQLLDKGLNVSVVVNGYHGLKKDEKGKYPIISELGIDKAKKDKRIKDYYILPVSNDVGRANTEGNEVLKNFMKQGHLISNSKKQEGFSLLKIGAFNTYYRSIKEVLNPILNNEDKEKDNG